MSARTLLMAAATAGPPGASLNLSFGGPTLDPRITFTRASTATYFDATGTMQTAATNAPRFDYDPVTHALNGLLIEDARTNSALQSSDFTNAAWTKAGCAASRPGSGAPDGTSFNLITEDTTNASHSFYGTGITVTAARWTVSVYVRVGTQRYISLRGENTAGSVWPWITFDTQTATINANAAVSASGFTAVAGGTYRIWLSWVALAAPGANMVVAGCNTAAAPATGTTTGTVYLGTSQTWSAWGMQVEAGPMPTSYVPTTAAAVTRAQDSCTIPPANMGWFMSPGGSWQIEFIFFDPAPVNQRVIGQPTLTGGGLAPIFVDTARHINQYDGSIAIGTANATAPNTVVKGASTWTANTGKVCLGGGAVVSGALTNGYNVLVAGGVAFLVSANPGVTDNMCGYIRRVRYWPRVLADAEMQQVTR